MNHSLKNLFAELAVSVAAGFTEQLAESMKAEAQSVGDHPQARTIGAQIAGQMLGQPQPPTVQQPPPLAAPYLPDHPHPAIGQLPIYQQPPLAVYQQPVSITPEMLQTLALLQQQSTSRVLDHPANHPAGYLP